MYIKVTRLLGSLFALHLIKKDKYFFKDISISNFQTTKRIFYKIFK